MNWILPEATRVAAAAMLTKDMGLHPLTARVLAARGFASADDVQTFLADRLGDLPDPGSMKGMSEGVARVVSALRTGEKITLYGDYDVDGVCSTALLNLFLKSLGGNVATYIPHRLEEGYGLNIAAVERIAQEGARLMVTLDCGITSHAEVARANDLGMDVVIVDHHTVPATLPPARAVLNPHQPGCGYPTKQLCAAGVAFNLCIGIRQRLRAEGFFSSRPEPLLRSLLDLVALATICDMVPLSGANRVLVKHGLVELTQGHRPGIRALKEVAGLGAMSAVGATQVGFRLGPRLNAAGRLDDASIGLRLLCTSDEREAQRLASQLDAANAERQAIEKEMVVEALAQAEAYRSARGLVLYSDRWHPGVVGIAASRVVERFHRPAVLIAVREGLGRGSARSIEGFHLFDALAECSGHLARFGGHKHAAGVSIEPSQLEGFREAFAKVAASRLNDADLTPRCRIDAEVQAHELNEAALEGLNLLAPFGQGNPEPIFALRQQRSSTQVLPDKSGRGAGHLKLRLQAAPHLDAIGFGMAERVAVGKEPVDLAFQLCADEWRGVRRLSLKLKDLRASAL